MTVKKIRHAVFEWFDPDDGARHYAYRGEEVDVPDSVIDEFARYEPFFEESAVSEGEASEDESAGDEADDDEVGDEAPPRAPATAEAPKRAATKDAWVEFAVERGFDRAQAETLTKDELIAALS